MSGFGPIKRRCLARVPGRTNPYRIASINPQIGTRGPARTKEEYTFYIRSTDRFYTESPNSFTVKIPDGPSIPVNSNVKIQLVQASIPNNFYLLRNQRVRIAWATNFDDILLAWDNIDLQLKKEKILTGFYNMTTDDNKYITEVVDQLDDPLPLLYWDSRTNRLLNRTKFYLRIEVMDDYGRRALGFPDDSQRRNLEGLFPILKNIPANVMFLSPFPGDFEEWQNNVSSIGIEPGNEVDIPYALLNPMVQVPTSIYIRLSNEQLPSVYETVEPDIISNTDHSTIIAMIPCSAGFGQLITYYNDFFFSELDARQDFKEFKLELCDEDGRVVPANSCPDWQCQIKLIWRPEDKAAR